METAHERALDELPDHLEHAGDGRIRCLDCDAEGLRPLAHGEGCEHDREIGSGDGGER